MVAYSICAQWTGKYDQARRQAEKNRNLCRPYPARAEDRPRKYRGVRAGGCKGQQIQVREKRDEATTEAATTAPNDNNRNHRGKK